MFFRFDIISGVELLLRIINQKGQAICRIKLGPSIFPFLFSYGLMKCTACYETIELWDSIFFWKRICVGKECVSSNFVKKKGEA